jgi:hypothetical protein
MSEIEDILKDESALCITDERLESTADLITRLNAKAIVEAYRAGKEAGQAERDRLRELVKMAYCEGWNNYHRLENIHNSWLQSESRAVLQGYRR